MVDIAPASTTSSATAESLHGTTAAVDATVSPTAVDVDGIAATSVETTLPTLAVDLPAASPSESGSVRAEATLAADTATDRVNTSRHAAVPMLVANVPTVAVEATQSVESLPVPARLAPDARAASDGRSSSKPVEMALVPVQLGLGDDLVTEVPALEEADDANAGATPERRPAVAAAEASAARQRAALAQDATPTEWKTLAAPFEISPSPMVAVDDRLAADAAAPGDLVPALPMFEAASVMLADLDLHLPRQVAPPTSPYEQRSEKVREEMVTQGGGDRETEKAVRLALAWLARHQSDDGRWSSRYFDRGCGQCGGASKVDSDIALTGLSVLCFLAAGHAPGGDSEYGRVVERGVRYLLGRQASSGDLMGDESMYSHGIATMALAEAYGMTADPRLAGPVRMAASFIYEARNRSVGGWRYDPGQAGDTSVLGWQVMAVKSAERAGVEVPVSAYRVAADWLRKVRDPWQPGLYSYQPRRRVTPTMTAEGMFVQQLLGAERDEQHMRESAAYVLEHLPSWADNPNTYYWYYATLALFQHGGEEWSRWNELMKEELVAQQHADGRLAGSWDPEGKWATVGGRVYQTALCCLTLEVYYRYLPLYVVED
jgi:hypothetical protein